MATINDSDRGSDGELDADQVIGPTHDPLLSFEDVDNASDLHVVAALDVDGGGNFNPESGGDYIAYREKVIFGKGVVDVDLDLTLAPS
jgi:hypothetical protein